MKKLLTVVLCLIIAAAAGFGGWYYFTHTGGEYHLKQTEEWKFVDTADYMVKLPTDLQPKSTINIDNSFRDLGTSVSDAIGFTVGVAEMDTKQATALRKVGLMAVMEMVHRSINGVELIPIERDNYVYTEYKRHAIGYFKSTDDVWTMDAIYVAGDKLYEVHLFCPDNKFSDYKPYMLEILDSFRGK